MKTSFKILFMIELLHDFYKGGKCTDFRLLPDEPTSRLLKNCNALYKTVGNKLVVLIKSDESTKPFIAPKTTDRFTFYIELMNPLFTTVSGVDFSSLASKRFYFTNIHQNKVSAGDDVFYLSKALPDYNPLTNYFPGDFVKQAGTVYESIKASVGVTPPDTANWASRSKNQYASKEDMVQLITSNHTFKVEPLASDIQISLYSLNPATNLFDVQVYENVTSFEEPVSTIFVNLSNLPEAKYRAVVNGTETFVYISNTAVYQNMFGVVDLYNSLADGNDFSFFDNAGKIKDQVIASENVWMNYTIRFANRMAFWRYIVPKKGVQKIDSNPEYSFTGNANPADFFTSQQPIPLQEQPHEFKLTLFQPISAEPPPAPNPDVNASGMLNKSGSDYYCHIYLNY